MTFSKILCPTDFSEGAQRAVGVAVRLAREAGVELVLLHSWYVAPIPFSVGEPFPPDVVQTMIDEGQRRLDVAVSDAIEAGAKRTTARLMTGTPWGEIVSVLEDPAFDLCVIGTHGRSGLSRVLLGSTAENVIRYAPCSVLAVRPDNHAGPFKCVLVPTDYSESSNAALVIAQATVDTGGTLTLLHVNDVPISYSGKESFIELQADMEQRSEAALDQLATTIRTVRVSTRSRIGRPGAQILATIDDDDTIDLVVMGSTGRGGIKRRLLGSVAEKVIRHARCPVLIARKR